jgi:hypothetical protein
MSTSPDEGESTLRYGDGSTSEIETVANELLALVDELEAGFSGGNLPPAFVERLAGLRETAERLIDP